MSPSDIPKMIAPIIENDYDYVSGSRFYENKNYITTPLFRKFSIKILSFIFSLLFKKKISDATCGFKAFKVNIFKNKLMNFNKKKFYSYAFEYYFFGKVLISKKIKHCESNVMMRYPKKGKYSHIRPFLDWFVILAGYIQAKLDDKKIFD
jgi:dolichol-phosphate mannosyltransferase